MVSMNQETMEHHRRDRAACGNGGVTPDLDGAAYGATSEKARAVLKEVAA